MTFSIKNLKLKTKLILITTISIIITTFVISFISFINMKNLSESLTKELYLKKLNADIHAADLYCKKFYGKLTLVNQELIDQTGQKIAGDFSLVDQILSDLGSVATVFVKNDDDFVRVVTNIKKEDGSRAIGTTLGKDSPAYKPITEGKLYIGEAKILGKNHYTAYNPIKNQKNEIIGIMFVGIEKTIAENIENQFMKNTHNKILIATLMIIIIILPIMMLIAIKMVKPLIDLTNKMDQASNGDFTGIIDYKLLKRKDEFGRLANAYQLLSASTIKMLNKLHKVSNQLLKISDHTCISSQNLSLSAQNQLSSSIEMVKIVEEISKSIDNVSENCTRLANSINNSTRNSLAIKNKITDAILIAKHGKLDMDKIINEINTIKESTSLLSVSISETANVTTQIKEVLGLLENISKQTNLISIATSIEAVKAGEAGKSFTIIAEKIGIFSEETSKATKNIAKLLEKIETMINTTISKSSHNVEQINQSVNLIANSGLNFEQIYYSIQETTIMLQEILSNIEAINTVAQDVASATEEQSASSEEVLATLECINELSEKVASDSDNVKNSADNSSQAANELHEIILHFKIN